MPEGRKRKRKGARREVSVDDVLQGRARASIEQLFALIHDVNPTDRALSEGARNERYRVKAELQSLLVLQHGSELEVSLEPELGEQVVSLRHRASGRDACHARLDALAPEARSWVQRMLDLGDARSADAGNAMPAAPRAAGSGREEALGSSEELLRAGAQAAEEYDFERARELLSAAGEQMHAVAEAVGLRVARVLLELLVDQLAENAEALAWQDRLPSAVAADAGVRCLLALAAARNGEAERARKLIAGVEDERVDSVRVELARALLERDELDACARELEAIGPASFAAASAASLAELLRARRVLAAEALVARLQTAVAGGLADTAARETARAVAREILALDAECEQARATLREITAHEEREQLRRAEQEVEEALAAGDPRRAALVMSREPKLAQANPEFVRRVRDATERQELRERDAEIEHLAALLAGDLTGAVVERYWSANEHVRSAARGRGDRDELRWLDELGPVHGHNACRSAAVVVAALVRLGDERLAMLDVLAQHEALVRRSEAARRAVDEARAAVAAERVAAARATLERCEREIDALESESEASTGTEWDALRARVETIAKADLDEEAYARFENLRARIAHKNDVITSVARFEQRVRAGDLLGARAIAAELAERSSGVERARWDEEHARLAREIQDLWIVQTVTDPRIADQLSDQPLPSDPAGNAQVWFTPGARELVLVSSADRWVFVRCIDARIEAQAAVRSRAVVIRTPRPIGDCGWLVDGNRLWILGMDAVLAVALDSWDVLLWRELPADQNSRRGSFVVPPRYVWRLGDDEEAVIIDVETGRVSRRIRCFLGRTVAGAEPPCVLLCPDADQGVACCSARGSTIWRDDTAPVRVEGGVLHPSGVGMLLAVGVPDVPPGSTDEAPFWSLVLREHDGREFGRSIVLPHGDAERIHVKATSIAEARTYVAYATDIEGDPPRLVVVGLDGDMAVEDVAIPEIPLLVVDDKSHHVAALVAGECGIAVVRFGASAPEPTSLETRTTRAKLPTRPSHWHCTFPNGVLSHRVSEVRVFLHGLKDAASIAVRDMTAEYASVPTELAKLLRACPDHVAPDVIERLSARLGELAHPLERLILAHRAATRGDFDTCCERLLGIDASALDAPSRQHLWHLHAHVAYATGDTDALLAALDVADAVDGGACKLGTLRSMATLLPATDDELLAAGCSGTPAVLLAIRRADRQLACGDAAGAIASLDTRHAWLGRHPQVLARLAEAYLGIEPRDDYGVFRKRLVLAAAVAPAEAMWSELRLGRATWSEDRMRATLDRARDWLAV